MCWLYTENNAHGSAQTDILGAFTTSCLPRENQATVFLVRGYSVVIQEGESWQQEAQAAIPSPPDCFATVNPFELQDWLKFSQASGETLEEAGVQCISSTFLSLGGTESWVFLSPHSVLERRGGMASLITDFSLHPCSRLLGCGTHLSSKTGSTEVGSLVSLHGKAGSLDVQTDPSLLW